MANLWTKEEEQIIIDNPNLTNKELGILLRKTTKSVWQKRHNGPNSPKEYKYNVNDKNGFLKLVKRLKNDNGLFECSCTHPKCKKNIKARISDTLNNRKSCISKMWYGEENIGEIRGSHWTRIKYRASKRNLEFSITKEEAWEIFLKQNRKCKLSGRTIGFEYDKQRGGRREKKICSASLDRIDNSIGYTKDNCQWLHKDVNMMKHIWDQDTFIQICKEVAKNLEN